MPDIIHVSRVGLRNRRGDATRPHYARRTTNTLFLPSTRNIVGEAHVKKKKNSLEKAYLTIATRPK